MLQRPPNHLRFKRKRPLTACSSSRQLCSRFTGSPVKADGWLRIATANDAYFADYAFCGVPPCPFSMRRTRSACGAAHPMRASINVPSPSSTSRNVYQGGERSGKVEFLNPSHMPIIQPQGTEKFTLTFCWLTERERAMYRPLNSWLSSTIGRCSVSRSTSPRTGRMRRMWSRMHF